MLTRLAATSLSGLIVLAALPAQADKCEGCACRGGPGYRDAKGQCVGHAQLYSRCGTPPTTRCTFEGASHVGRSAVPPEWSPADHAQWLAARNAARRPDAANEGTTPARQPPP